MKILDTTAITNASQFPVKKGTLQFMQDAHRESLAATIKSLIGPSYNSAVIYMMSGGINSGVLPTYNVAAGAIFYNGEVYDFAGASFTATGSNVGVWTTLQTQYTTDADPVTFTDSTVRNVHNIRKMQLSQALTGTGLADFSQTYFLSFQIPALLNLTAPVASPYVGNQMQLIGTYPNIIAYVPAASNLNPALSSGSLNVGNIGSSGYNSFVVTFPTALLTTNYIIMGSIISNGTDYLDATVLWVIKNKTTTTFTVTLREDSSVLQNVAFEWIAFSK